MASTITELEIIQPNIMGGRKIKMDRLGVTNHRIHCAGQMVSMMMVANLEGDSNNTASTMTPREVREHWVQWSAFKEEIQFARDNNDGPLTKLEDNLALLIPNGVEIQQIKNQKCKRVALELRRLVRIMVSVDSAGSQVNVGDSSFADIQAQVVICEKAMIHYWGTGADNENTGVSMPEYKHVGVMIPDIDNDEHSLSEASVDGPDIGYSDAPDTAIK